MSEKSLGSYILIDPDDCPNREQLDTAIRRLTKDVGILIKMSDKQWPVEDLRQVLGFLELIQNDPRIEEVKKQKKKESKQAT